MLYGFPIFVSVIPCPSNLNPIFSVQKLGKSYFPFYHIYKKLQSNIWKRICLIKKVQEIKTSIATYCTDGSMRSLSMLIP
jgi:hypothetical protein